MSEDLNEIRTILLEVHGDLKAHGQKLDDHIRWSEDIHANREAQIADIDKRVASTESSVHIIKFVSGIAVAAVAVPTGLWKIVKLIAEKLGE